MVFATNITVKVLKLRKHFEHTKIDLGHLGGAVSYTSDP